MKSVLSKEICKRCWREEGETKWDSDSDSRWCCRAAYYIVKIDDEQPPEECFYYLEHVLEDVNAE